MALCDRNNSTFRQQYKGDNYDFYIYVAPFFYAVVYLSNRCLQSLLLLLLLLLLHTDQTSTGIFQSSAARQHFSDRSRVAVVDIDLAESEGGEHIRLIRNQLID